MEPELTLMRSIDKMSETRRDVQLESLIIPEVRVFFGWLHLCTPFALHLEELPQNAGNSMVFDAPESTPAPSNRLMSKCRVTSQAGRRGFEPRLPLHLFNNLRRVVEFVLRLCSVDSQPFCNGLKIQSLNKSAMCSVQPLWNLCRFWPLWPFLPNRSMESRLHFRALFSSPIRPTTGIHLLSPGHRMH